jgi:hypothetical protein
MPGQVEWIRIYDSLNFHSSESFSMAPPGATLTRPQTGAWTNPIIHQLLSFRPCQQYGLSNQSHIQEACRLGSLIYMALVWRAFGVSPFRSDILVRKLRGFLETQEIEWLRLWKLQLWILCMGAIESESVDDKRWSANWMAVLLQKHEIRSWSQGLECVREILWVERLFRGRDQELGKIIDSPIMDLL